MNVYIYIITTGSSDIHLSSFLARTMPRKVSYGLDFDEDYDEYDDYDYYDNDFDVEEKGRELLSLTTFHFSIFHNSFYIFFFLNLAI